MVPGERLFSPDRCPPIVPIAGRTDECRRKERSTRAGLTNGTRTHRRVPVSPSYQSQLARGDHGVRCQPHSSAGQTSEGPIDCRFVLEANSSSPNGSFDVAWGPGGLTVAQSGLGAVTVGDEP